ncbi:hypothetical protein C8R47DRAFT_1072509 [Mycena vitilis]|nr:hypothetical protein C8R47DRAFT_1072509 [Mycena vitilis]
MFLPLFLRILLKQLALALSPAPVHMGGLWDRERLRTESSQDLRAWKCALLLEPRREALNNGVIVTKVDHLKDSSDKKWQHEFLCIHVVHEKSKARLAFIVDRNFYPKDLEGPPETDSGPGVESLKVEKERKKPSFFSRTLKRSAIEQAVPSTEVAKDRFPHPKDVPEEKDLSLLITHISGQVVHHSEPFFPAHTIIDRVHRGVGDLEKRTSTGILKLQTLVFPECSRPSVITLAFFLAALSEFGPQYHAGEFQCSWFARAACDGMHAMFRGRLRPGPDIGAMGKWKTATFKYTSPWTSITAEYSRQLNEYEDNYSVGGRQLSVQTRASARSRG